MHDFLRLAPGTTVAQLDQDSIVWGRDQPTATVSTVTATILRYLTGSVPLHEMAADVTAEAGENEWKRCLSEFVSLVSQGLVVGSDPDLPVDPERSDGSGFTLKAIGAAGPGSFTLSLGGDPDHVPENGDGQQEVETDPNRSLGERVAVDSCVGKRIDPARQGEAVNLDLGERPITVQTNSPLLGSMLRSTAPLAQSKGPVEVFSVSTARSDGCEGKTRLYDGTGELFAMAVDYREAAAHIDAMACALRPLRNTGVPLVASGFFYRGAVVLADRALTASPVLLRYAKSAGVAALPARRYMLVDDSRALPDVGLGHVANKSDPFEIFGIVSFGLDRNTDISSTARGLLGNLRSDDDDSRGAALAGVSELLRRCPLISADGGLRDLANKIAEHLGVERSRP